MIHSSVAFLHLSWYIFPYFFFLSPNKVLRAYFPLLSEWHCIQRTAVWCIAKLPHLPQSSTLHCPAQQCDEYQNYIALSFTALLWDSSGSESFHWESVMRWILHCTSQQSLHCTALYCTALYCTALHSTALQCIDLYCISQSFTLYSSYQ